MSKKRKILITAAAVILLAALAVGITAVATNNFGTAEDPLISLSYLTNTLTPNLKSQFQTMLDSSEDSLTTYIDAQVEAAKNQSGTSGGESYKVVTLSKGQTISGAVGCEFILRIGSAACAGDDSPGLVNTSTGGTIDAGEELVKNNVYLVSIKGNGIKATGGTVKVLVRGSYTIN